MTRYSRYGIFFFFRLWCVLEFRATGDGIKMTMTIGGSTIDLEWVQVNPTGLVKIGGAEDEKIK